MADGRACWRYFSGYDRWILVFASMAVPPRGVCFACPGVMKSKRGKSWVTGNREALACDAREADKMK